MHGPHLLSLRQTPQAQRQQVRQMTRIRTGQARIALLREGIIWPREQSTMNRGTSMPVRSISFGTTAIGVALAALPVSSVLAADVTLPPISVGVGVRSSFTQTNPDIGEDISDFELNSARIYI